MVDYILEEGVEIIEKEPFCENRFNDIDGESRPAFLDTLESRLPILLECLENKYVPAILRKLVCSSDLVQ